MEGREGKKLSLADNVLEDKPNGGCRRLGGQGKGLARGRGSGRGMGRRGNPDVGRGQGMGLGPCSFNKKSNK